MSSTPTRYHLRPNFDENPETGETVTAVTGDFLPIAQRAYVRACAQKSASVPLPPLPPPTVEGQP